MNIGALRRRIDTLGGEDYIKDGLVFWLNGEDATTNKWIDRIGGYVFELTGTFAIDTESGGVTFTAGRGYCSTSSDFKSSTHTIEAVFKVNSQADNPNMGIFTNQINGGLALGKYGNYKIWSSITTREPQWTTGFDYKPQVITVKPMVYCYKNRVAISKGADDNFGLYNMGGMFIGDRAVNTYPFHGTIYQIRVYNRTLTKEEVMHNQSIDIDKYKI